MSDTELSVTRFIAAPPDRVWDVYVNRATEWFTPAPWTTPEVDYDLRPGGRANVVMQSPEGDLHAYQGVVLAVEPGRRIVTTGSMTEGFVPQAGDMPFVRTDTFEPEGDGTRYTARARHWNGDDARKHEEMGFSVGWGMAMDQLAALAEKG